MNIQHFSQLCKACCKHFRFTSSLIQRSIYSNWLPLIPNEIARKQMLSSNEKSYVMSLQSHSFSQSTVSSATIPNDSTFFKRLLDKLKFVSVRESRLHVTAFLLYESIADKLNYVEFFEKFNLPDTFYSWFAITELHVWILSVRCMEEGDDGRFVRNKIMDALWFDVQERVKKLGASNPSVTRLQVSELSDQFRAAMIAYDEGLLSDDVVLAGAVWRRMYQQGEVDPEYLDSIVQYIRKHIYLLDGTSREVLFSNKFTFSD